jgi:hypothetical protein
MGLKSIVLAALLCTTALPVRSDPATISYVLGVFGAGATGASASAYIAGFAFSQTLVGGFLVQLGGSMLLSAIGKAVAGTPKGPELIRQAQFPVSLPQKRFIYGAPRIYGAPAWRVKGQYLYCAMILNSRPSDAITKLFFDKRECTLTGDMYDLVGAGAVASAAPFAGYVTVWAGLGSQTAAPLTITAEAPDLFLPTDAGQGLTILWLRLDAGGNKSRAERWPAFPPEVEIEGRFSKVWDPRDGVQDPDDATTWEWSANQALCTLDAVRQNPIQPYPLGQVTVDLFSEAADVADQAVTLNAGGTELRYEVHGGLVFDGSELMDQLLPLFTAGAADPVRVGGRLGIIPGVYSSPVMTVSDITEAEGIEFQSLKPGRDLATTVRCTFTDPARDWRTSELTDYTVPDAQDADGGTLKSVQLALPLVKSATQAMRIQKLTAHRQRAQRQITCTLPPKAFKLIAGCNVTVDFPAPYTILNGTYRVTKANPGLSAGEEAGGGVAMRVPVVLEEIAAEDFDWTPAIDEQPRTAVTFDGTVPAMAPPGAITTTTGAAVAIRIGDAYAPAIRFAFDPSTSASAVTYEWQFKADAGDWTPGGLIDAEIRDGASKVFGFLTAITLGPDYTIRARAIGASASTWVSSTPIEATLGVARYDADFQNVTYAVAEVAGTIGNVLGLARASTATYVDSGNVIQTAAINVPRLDYLSGVRALLIEPSATNLLLNSTTLSTQSATVTAVPHTLSFRGTGTVTLSGASTAGPLVGTGAGNLVTLTFTPSAGSLTLTVTGSVTNAQLEVGAAASSWIPTTGAAATRAADVPTMQGITGVMDLLATYGDGTTAAFDASPVIPGFWPALTKTRLRRLIGTI